MDDAPPAGLVRADLSGPGLTRRRCGRGFSYHAPDGATISDTAVRDRIRTLAIPPAWRDVWIAPDPDAHIQAVGTDAAGRRQYRYHEQWRRARDEAKHDRVLTLGAVLADVRAEVARRLAAPGLGADRVLAGGVRLLDIGVFRAGGEEYAPDDDQDGTFGLATLLREHVRLRRGAVLFAYPAKGGVARTLALRDPSVHRLVNSLLRRRGGGADLLAYRMGRRDWHDVRAEDLNAAVKDLAGPEYTCKDLRTWNATVLAAVTLAGSAAGSGVPERERPRARVVNDAVRTVAEHLGNTPAVARSSYIDPRVLQRFDQGRTVLAALRRLQNSGLGNSSSTAPGTAGPDLTDDSTRAAVERAVLRLVRS